MAKLSWRKIQYIGAVGIGVSILVISSNYIIDDIRYRNEPLPPRSGQIIPNPNQPAWLSMHEKGPLFICETGDPEGFLYRGDLLKDGTRQGDQEDLIKKLAYTGANSIYLMAVRSHGGDGDKTENPFMEHNPSKGINPKILDQWNKWFTQLDKQGIFIFFFIYDDDAEIWNAWSLVSSAEEKFLRALAERFNHPQNLVWVVAEEYAEELTPRRVSRIAAILRDADRYGHPIAVHKNHGLDFSEFANDPNVDLYAIQYNAESADKIYAAIVEAWNLAAGKYGLILAESDDWESGREARRKAWAAALTGAYAMVYG